MSYNYERAVPVSYKKYKLNKEIEFPDTVKVQLDAFFDYIVKVEKSVYHNENGKIQKKTLIKDLSAKYADLREKYIKPEVDEKYHYKLIAYTQEEVDFIFQCGYKLIERFGLSQNEIAAVFGMNSNKFAKLGCFPMRCYQAYTKFAGKSLIPNDTKSEGIRIADCINKKVQAVYGCSAFIGVTNMLDIFANISSTDNKAYILTRPLECNEQNVVSRYLAYPRFLFATANNLENDTNTIPRRYVAGKLKKQIIDFLQMKENEVLMYSSICEKMIKSGEMEQRFIASADLNRFQEDVELYRNQLGCIEDIDKGFYGDEYFEDENSLEECGLAGLEIDFDDADAVRRILLDSTRKLYEKLVRRLTFAKLSGYDAGVFQDYKMALVAMLVKKNELFSDYQRGVRNLEKDEDKIQLASIFWIIETFGLDENSESDRDNVLKYLKTEGLCKYVDLMNKEVKKGEETHLYFEDDNFIVQRILNKVKTKSPVQPMLLYIDTMDYQLTRTTIQSLLEKNNIVLVVRDTVNICRKAGLSILDKKLQLYIGEK